MFCERTSVGLDVHARSVVAAAIDGRSGEVFRARLTPSHADVIEWVGKLPGPCAVVYEAGPTGFGLARALSAAGLRCEVAASSKLLRPAGDRVKTDARDALNLARLLRLDEVVPVRIPSVAEEAARDLARTREAARADLIRARHRLSKLLLRHGIVYYDGKAWTERHDRWLHHQRFDAAPTQCAFEDAYEAVVLATARRARLDEKITALAADSEFSPLTRRLASIDTHVTAHGHVVQNQAQPAGVAGVGEAAGRDQIAITTWSDLGEVALNRPVRHHIGAQIRSHAHRVGLAGGSNQVAEPLFCQPR